MSSFLLDIRKLAGRLLCEATYNSDTNQQYLMQTIAASK